MTGPLMQLGGLLAVLLCIFSVFFLLLFIGLDLAHRHRWRQELLRVCPICEINQSKEGHHDHV